MWDETNGSSDESKVVSGLRPEKLTCPKLPNPPKSARWRTVELPARATPGPTLLPGHCLLASTRSDCSTNTTMVSAPDCFSCRMLIVSRRTIPLSSHLHSPLGARGRRPFGDRQHQTPHPPLVVVHLEALQAEDIHQCSRLVNSISHTRLKRARFRQGRQFPNLSLRATFLRLQPKGLGRQAIRRRFSADPTEE